MEEKKCILYDGRVCDSCGECNMCDLDPKKVCDSCGTCLNMDDDYNTLDVDLVMEDTDDPEMLSFEELFPDEAFGGDVSDWGQEDEDDEDYDYDESDFEDDFEDDFEEDDLKRDFGDFFGRN